MINPKYTCSLIIYIQSHASTHMSKHSATCMHDYEAQMMGNENTNLGTLVDAWKMMGNEKTNLGTLVDAWKA